MPFMSLASRPVGDGLKWLAAGHDGEKNSGVNEVRFGRVDGIRLSQRSYAWATSFYEQEKPRLRRTLRFRGDY